MSHFQIIVEKNATDAIINHTYKRSFFNHETKIKPDNLFFNGQSSLFKYLSSRLCSIFPFPFYVYPRNHLDSNLSIVINFYNYYSLNGRFKPEPEIKNPAESPPSVWRISPVDPACPMESFHPIPSGSNKKYNSTPFLSHEVNRFNEHTPSKPTTRLGIFSRLDINKSLNRW